MGRSSASAAKMKRAAFGDSHAADLEAWIDEMDAELPPLTSFILAGGGLTAAHLHHARAVCRRAERRVQELVALEEKVLTLVQEEQQVQIQLSDQEHL